MFSEAQLTQLASELDQSARNRQQLTHFSQRFPGMSVDDGYRISRAWVQMQIANGSQVIGHK
ncbi:MAG: 2-oxo-hepta-3-ene-1,7-dioic acid hydratase, partial [Stenotrophomonas sp.]